MRDQQEALEKKKQLELQMKIKKDAETIALQMQASIQRRNEELKNERILGN
jgi:hypothetical protein